MRRRPGLHRKCGAYWDGIAQTHGSLGGGHANALFALAAEQLCGFAGVVAEGNEDGGGCGEESIFAGGRGQFAEARSKHETALHVASDKAMIFERGCEAMCRGPCEVRDGHKLGECLWPGFERAQYRGCLIENTNATAVFFVRFWRDFFHRVHVLIFSSQYVRCKCAWVHNA